MNKDEYDDLMAVYNATVGKKEVAEEKSQITYISKQEKRQKAIKKAVDVTKKIIVGLIIAGLITAGALYIKKRDDMAEEAMAIYEQYLEWVAEKREYDPNYPIGEETYKLFIEEYNLNERIKK